MTRFAALRPLTRACLLTGLLLGAMGCEEDVDPFVESNQSFTVYGFLDPGEATQYLRVIPLRQVLTGEDETTIDAQVTTTELERGVTQTWADSLITFDNGSIGHVFYAQFRPIPGRTYRLEITRSDGAPATVAVTTLPIQPVAIFDDMFIGSATIGGRPVFSAVQPIIWEGLDFAPFRVEMWYRFANVPASKPFLDMVRTYDETDIGRAVEEGWRIDARLSRDGEDLGAGGLTMLGLGMRITLADDSWRPPGGVFDPEILVQPGTFSNVDNGFGFFGAVNQYTIEWVLDQDVVEGLGYRFPGEATP